MKTVIVQSAVCHQRWSGDATSVPAAGGEEAAGGGALPQEADVDRGTEQVARGLLQQRQGPPAAAGGSAGARFRCAPRVDGDGAAGCAVLMPSRVRIARATFRRPPVIVYERKLPGGGRRRNAGGVCLRAAALKVSRQQPAAVRNRETALRLTPCRMLGGTARVVPGSCGSAAATTHSCPVSGTSWGSVLLSSASLTSAQLTALPAPAAAAQRMAAEPETMGVAMDVPAHG